MAAYDDRQGVTDAFIRNALAVINRDLDANFDLGNFEYVPLWDAREHRVDMRLRACDPETAHIGALGLDVVFEAGEELRVEISTKFSPDDIVAELADAGFGDAELLTDAAGDFGLILARRA
jgi:L-histidine N-alpha-methyltransferase